MSKPIVTPQELAGEWKRSGGLDQARQSIITDFLASSQKNTIQTRLDTILPTILLRPSFKHRKEKDKRKLHAEIMGLVENNYSIIQGSAMEVERGITAGDRGKGIAEELGVLLRGSRGEYVKDVVLVEEGVDVPEKAELDPSPSTSNLLSSTNSATTSHSTSTSIPSSIALPPPPEDTMQVD